MPAHKLPSAEPTATNTEYRQVPNNNARLVSLLYQLTNKKANVNIMNLTGDTPLTLAIRNGHGTRVVQVGFEKNLFSLCEKTVFISKKRKNT